MRIPTPKNNSRLDRQKVAMHVTDLLVSAVVSLFIVAGISCTYGIDKLNLGLTTGSYNYLSVLHSLENYKFNLNQNDSLLLSCSIVIAISLLTIISYSLLHTYLSKKINKEDLIRKKKYQNYFAGTIAQRHQPVKVNDPKNKSTGEKEHLSIHDLTNTNNRILLLKELKGMHNLITGEEKQRLKELYYGLGFIDDLPAKFKSPDWVQRVEAIHEVKQFGVAKFYPTIFKLVNDSNSTVRRNSLIARIDLEENPLSILKDIDSKLSIWEKHNISLALERLPTHLIPNFQSLMKEYPLHHQFLSEMKIHFNQDIAKINQQANSKLYVA